MGSYKPNFIAMRRGLLEHHLPGIENENEGGDSRPVFIGYTTYLLKSLLVRIGEKSCGAAYKTCQKLRDNIIAGKGAGYDDLFHMEEWEAYALTHWVCDGKDDPLIWGGLQSKTCSPQWKHSHGRPAAVKQSV